MSLQLLSEQSVNDAWIRAGKPRFLRFRLKKVFKRFFCMKTEHQSATQKHMKNSPYTVRRISKDKSPMSEEKHHVKNEGEIDESHQSQIKF